MNKKFLLIFPLSVILILFTTLPAFAVDNSHFQYVTSINIKDDTHIIGNPADYNGVTFTKVGGTDTRITNSNTSYKVALTYYSPSYWVAGQTYRLEFIFSASSIDGMAICLSTTQSLTEGEQTYIVNDNTANVDYGYNYSFTYSGQPYLIFTFIMPAHSSCVISDIEVFSYNPNAVVESQNQQVIEQNSELHSGLFDSSETVEDISDVDLSQQESVIKDFFSTISSSFSSDLVVGIKGFVYYFNFLFDNLNSNFVGSIIKQLLNFSLITSLIVLILGIIRDNRQSSSDDYYDRRTHTIFRYNDKNSKNKKG